MNQYTLQTRPVVTAFLRHQGRILIVRRSALVGSYQGLWSAISGYLEDATPYAQVLREIHEETSLDATQVQLACAAPALEIPRRKAASAGLCIHFSLRSAGRNRCVWIGRIPNWPG